MPVIDGLNVMRYFCRMVRVVVILKRPSGTLSEVATYGKLQSFYSVDLNYRCAAG
ncbi:hypothetical protein FOMG_19037 [Fusarium oxysporum f. sp. melonis 26406]|jgi:hypothetical protein|uniref:Uncharacterized protein n=3 Tax=Fusarium oxysporum TaxID=5507 RepID=A0A3L6N403_FUSOX|nr:hypothetical protein FOVG_19968 [Fusarium oxysporum f. sp. pisi HDV247]EXK24225.1 hypothetical protein FOMG_19037 [Fusarium oxysporum f. sp. melonis 26406]RKK06837.1 hypothetical protein BFJ65_g18390 [Fusarium oxysporum f. sp. cepae]RKK10698.1 hypothetical protein BFJ65_g14693 [Fusarium oxysporum f. sp. cepae]RKK11103.1 hypothetical protein BFJ65_g15095 [Fusarium oxysporum f. sp. cepae]